MILTSLPALICPGRSMKARGPGVYNGVGVAVGSGVMVGAAVVTTGGMGVGLTFNPISIQPFTMATIAAKIANIPETMPMVPGSELVELFLSVFFPLAGFCFFW